MSLIKTLWKGIRRKTVVRRIVETVYEPDVVLNNNLLAGRTALVTGAAANIGKATVVELAKQGASIIAVDVDPTGLERLAAAVPADTPLTTFVVDVGRQDAVDKLCADIEASGTIVDILVNNVGIHTDLNDTFSGDFATWRRSFDVNLIGPFRLTQRIANRLVELGERGTVVFITSVHQWHIRGHPAYSASKAGLGILIKELADQYAESGIRVNGIAPGAVIAESDGVATELKHVPLHGLAIPPKYVGRNAVMLASEYFSRHTTGAVVLIDAGLLARGFLTRLPDQRPGWSSQ